MIFLKTTTHDCCQTLGAMLSVEYFQKELYYNRSMSCLDLSKKIKKSLPNTSLRLNELIAKGAVVENGYAPSTGGRKPLMYSLTIDNFMFTLTPWR